jgi:hypothetical protein
MGLASMGGVYRGQDGYTEGRVGTRGPGVFLGHGWGSEGADMPGVVEWSLDGMGEA